MKDYSVLEGLDNNFMIELRCAYDRGYRQGRDDEWAATQAKQKEEEDYNRGVNDLWESVCKFMDADIVSDKEIWGCTSWEKFAQLSPSEVIERLKEYNKKQEHIVRCCKNCKHSENGMVGNSKRCEVCYYNEVSKGNTLFEAMETDNSKIEVGDEIICYGVGQKAVVFEVLDDNNYKCFSKKYGATTEDSKSVKTGRRFPEMVELIKHMENTDA